MIGKIISHYKILEKLGGGGMGIVYKAEDIKLERIIALKFLPLHLANNEADKKRFIHEAKAASALEHNNICTIHEINETSDGQLFIVMSYLEGKTLRNKIDASPLKIDEAIDIANQMSEGLKIAHEKGIVHRDIKPSNIMITKDGTVKIMDFGLAKLDTKTKLTQLGTTLGTFSYMSPEQSLGVEVDKRTDIWAVGVVLFEMLTGQLPFKGDYEQAIIYSLINEQHQPVTSLRSGIPMELERIVDKLLKKETGERYQNLDDLIVDLKNCNDLEINKKSNSTSKKSNVHFTNNKVSKTPLIIVVGILLMITFYLIYNLYFQTDNSINEYDQKKFENSLAVLPFTDLSPDKDQEYFCDGMTEQIITDLSKLEGIKIIARTSIMKFKNTKKSIKEIGKELGISKILEGSVRKYKNQIRVTTQLINVIDDFHIWSEDYDSELKNIFQVQDDISNSIAQTLLKQISKKEEEEIKGYKPRNAEAYEYYLSGKYHSRKYFSVNNIEDFYTSESLLKKSIELDSNYALSYAQLADLYNSYTNNVPKTDPKKKLYNELQKKYIQKALQTNSESSEVYTIKANIDWYFNKVEDSFEDIIQAYTLNPQSTEAIFAIGRLYHNINLYDKAIEKFTIAIEHDPFSSFYYAKRGWSYFRMGQNAKAEKDLLHAIKIDTLSLIARAEYSYFLNSQNRSNEIKNYNIGNSPYLSDWFAKANYANEQAKLGNKTQALKYIKIIPINSRLDVYLILNMQDKALSLLEKRIEACFIWDYGCYYKVLLNYLGFDRIRSNKRFIKILQNQKELYNYYISKYGNVSN